ncbi:MAG TPA: hypothetical protein VF529_09535 [Solirubrobacteraceae bacterium]|jgi:hypothetical protein
MVPTFAANSIAAIPPLWDEVWKELTGKCGAVVSGIDGSASESLKQQLDCHIVGAGFPGIGPTWDFEAWKENRSLVDFIRSRACTSPLSSTAATAYDGWLVHWSDDPARPRTSWLVVNDGGRLGRNWIPTGAIFNCLRDRGHRGPIELHGDYLSEALPDQRGVHAECSAPSPPSSTPSPSPSQAQPAPQPQPSPTTPPAGCHGAGGTSSGGPGNAGFHIQDIFYGGTWARTDPCDGTWHPKSNPPANGAYWYPNGLGVGVDCARTGAAYTVRWADGHTETWNTWFHVTDGKWFPSAAAQETTNNSFYGLPAC